MRIMNRLPLHMRQLRHPFSDTVPILIVFLTLQQRIKDPKIRLRIHARACAEPPSAIVGSKIAVDEMFHKISFAHPPVDEEVFG